jgi:hypothetical protein
MKATQKVARWVSNTVLSLAGLSSEAHIAPVQMQPYCLDPTIIAAFWERVENKDGCWLWKGRISSQGYPELVFAKSRSTKAMSAQRISYQLQFGKIAENIVVWHTKKCPKICINPFHLTAGTRRQSALYMHSVGRMKTQKFDTKGEKHWGTKFTGEQVSSMRKQYAAGGITQRQLASLHGVHYNTINAILRGKNWKTETEV